MATKSIAPKPHRSNKKVSRTKRQTARELAAFYGAYDEGFRDGEKSMFYKIEYALELEEETLKALIEGRGIQ